MSWSQKNETSK